jgi:D-inositol-3-phosphate glycosyltransferase
MNISTEGSDIVSKPKLLWVGDITIHSGFATVARNILEHLRHTWDVAGLGVSYVGDPHNLPYPVYSIISTSKTSDPFGASKLPEVLDQVKPDVVFILHDTWIVGDVYLPVLRDYPNVKVAAYMPVDAPNLKPAVMDDISKLDLAVWYTDFGHLEALAGGFVGRAAVIPHGVDLKLYHPVPRAKARAALKLPENIFVVGYVGRNQPRKRLDLLIEAFATWRQKHQVEDTRLFMHCSPMDQAGWDLLQLGSYHGCHDAMIYTEDVSPIKGIPEEHLKYVYSACDLMANVSFGEGWSLPTMEAMACGTPSIAPAWGGLADWGKGALHLMPVTGTFATPALINTLGGLVTRDDVVEALHTVYSSPTRRAELSRLGLALVHQPRFRWEAIARQFDERLRALL